MTQEELNLKVAEAAVEVTVKACRQALLEAYESAGMSGLCAEGRWEAALDALHGLPLAKIAAEATAKIFPVGPDSQPAKSR